MKKLKIIPIIIFIGGFICGLTYITYAGIYNSEEISYDNSNSHAEAENVKDAIDYLYSHGSCGEGMSCIKNPFLFFSVQENGSSNNLYIHIEKGSSEKIKITPNAGYYLKSIQCSNGYVVGQYETFNTNSSIASSEQEIIITNQNSTENGVCNVLFETGEIFIASKGYPNNGYDTCNSAGENCVCWYIKNGGNNFTYGSHTGCNFKDYKCFYNFNRTGNANCNSVFYASNNAWCDNSTCGGYGSVMCSGTIICAT